MKFTDETTQRAIRTLKTGDMWSVALTDLSTPNIRITQHSRSVATLSCTVGTEQVPQYDTNHLDELTRGLPDSPGTPSRYEAVAPIGGKLLVNILCQSGVARVEVEVYE